MLYFLYFCINNIINVNFICETINISSGQISPQSGRYNPHAQSYCEKTFTSIPISTGKKIATLRSPYTDIPTDISTNRFPLPSLPSPFTCSQISLALYITHYQTKIKHKHRKLIRRIIVSTF